jgi:aryl-alcohol dehydrogenase-like predicted oxidoreductase
MDYTMLGRTGLKVSRMGLGCGGPSRLGLKAGGTEVSAEAVVREAIDLGVNFLDTAEAYGTEEVVGRAIRTVPREQVVLSTKAGVNWQERRSTQAEFRERIESNLRRLGADYIDIFHLHGVSANDYEYARDELLPVVQEMRTEGKIRFTGLTETFGSDPGHAMLSKALKDPLWDVVMVGFNLLNQSARERVLAATQAQGIGTLCMFAVRRALSRPEALREQMADLVARSLVDAGDFDPADPLGFLLLEGSARQRASSLPDAAYRFCRWEPGLDVILSGTSNIAHLRENAASLERPALSEPAVQRLRQIFAKVDCISGN